MPKQKSLVSKTPFLKPANISSQEKDVLLSLNNDFASLPERKDFLVKIWPKLADLFHCKNVFICLLENDHLKPVLRIGDESRKKHEGYAELIKADIPIHDGLLDTVLASKGPCIFDLEAVVRWHDPPKYIDTLRQIGFKSSLSRRLSYGNNQLGILTFWSENERAFTEHHVELLELLVPPISIVLANVLARDAIQKNNRIMNNFTSSATR